MANLWAQKYNYDLVQHSLHTSHRFYSASINLHHFVSLIFQKNFFSIQINLALIVFNFPFYLFVLSYSCWFIYRLLFSYIVSVLKNDVYPAFPFISDTGTKSPESCLFSQLLNITSVLILVTLYLRSGQSLKLNSLLSILYLSHHLNIQVQTNRAILSWSSLQWE